MTSPTWTLLPSLEIILDFRFNATSHLDNDYIIENRKGFYAQ
jgi:hypothetical protein